MKTDNLGRTILSEEDLLDRLNFGLEIFGYVMTNTDPRVTTENNFDYYWLNMDTGHVVELNLNLEMFAQEVGALKYGEVLAE